MEYEYLLKPLKIRGLTLKNRMFSAPTSLAVLDENEHYSDANIRYYKMKACGGCAVVCVGDVITDRITGRSHPMQAGLDSDAEIPYFRKLADAIHEGGAAAEVEIDHGGALCDPEFIGGKCAIGPSGYIDKYGDEILEMSPEQIEEIAASYGDAALRAKKSGFDMVMIHMGHGWLIHQFISEYTNHRTDMYGGSFENRMRFPLLVLEKVGEDYPVDVRISGSERMEGGYDIDTGIRIAMALDGKADLIHVSAGTQEDDYSAVLMHPGAFQQHGENSHLAAEIRKHVKTPVATVGAFSEPDKMEAFLKEGGADAIAMARALIADPFLPQKVSEGRVQDITPCLRCGSCQSGMMKNGILRCAVNPYIGREHLFFDPVPVHEKKKILIAGTGPCGTAAALEAQARGHEILAVEITDQAGALKYADNAPFKANIRRYRESLKDRLERSGVRVIYNTAVTDEIVHDFRPDVIITAVGSRPRMLNIPVYADADIRFAATLAPDEKTGRRICIIGGGLVGCEEAIVQADCGKEVTVIEYAEELAAECGRMHRISLIHEISIRHDISCHTGLACTGITQDGVTAEDRDGNKYIFEADTVLMAAGLVSLKEEISRLASYGCENVIAGDALRPEQIGQAVRSGFDAVLMAGLSKDKRPSGFDEY